MADYGNPPYHETAAKAALRLLLSGAPGWGAVPGGANFGSAFMASGGRSAIASQQANQAAERYALAQEETKRRAQEDAMQAKFMDAQIQQMAKEKPEPPQRPQAYVPTTQAEAIDYYRQQKEIDAKLRAQGGTGAGGGSGQALDPEAVKGLARVYRQIGNAAFASLGMGAGPLRAAAIARAFKDDPNADIAGAGMNYRSNLGSISNMQKIADTQGAFSDTADLNFQQVTDMMNKVPNGGNRLLNMSMRHLASLGGDPNVAAFNTALETARLEYIRILSTIGGAGGAALTDSQRHDMKRFAGDDFTPAQLLASFRVLKRDSANKQAMYNKKIREIQGRLPLGAPKTMEDLNTPQDQGGADFIYNPTTGELEPAQ